MSCAGAVHFLARKIDQTQRREIFCMPWIERHVLNIYLQLFVELLPRDDECGNRNRWGIRLFPFEVRVFDGRLHFLHKKLYAEIEPSVFGFERLK